MNFSVKMNFNKLQFFRDEYMLNKCSDQGMDGWFVVELCAEMQAFKIELANFELYSSGPKDFRVSMSYNFHGRENGWNLFGDFRAEDSKDIQTFISPEGKYVAYVLFSSALIGVKPYENFLQKQLIIYCIFLFRSIWKVRQSGNFFTLWE